MLWPNLVFCGPVLLIPHAHSHELAFLPRLLHNSLPCLLFLSHPHCSPPLPCQGTQVLPLSSTWLLLVFQISALTLGQVPLLLPQGTVHFLYHSIITGATPCYRLSVYILSLPKGSKLDKVKNQNVIPHCICIPGHNTVSIRVQTKKKNLLNNQ